MARDETRFFNFEAFSEDAPYDEADPERNLMRAILLNAMTDLRKQGSVGRQARDFFLSSDESHLFTFQSICNHLEVDPHSVLLVTGLRKSIFSAVSDSTADHSAETQRAPLATPNSNDSPD